MVGGKKQRAWWLLASGVIVSFLAAYLVWYLAELTALNNIELSAPQVITRTNSTITPQITPKVMLSGREFIWDMAVLPTGELLFAERAGKISMLAANGSAREIATVAGITTKGEGGLLGLAIDTKFKENRYIYACFSNVKGKQDVRVARWQLKPDNSGLERQTDILTGIEAAPSGLHSGCRLAFGPDGYLWVTTGDAAKSGLPQNPKSLNGKILRIDRDGKPARGNIGGEFDPRIYSYGHRVPQGIAFFVTPRSGVPGVSAEPGGTVDEVNILKSGNFGWAPADTNNSSGQASPMTDLDQYPDAVASIWSSGEAVQNPAGVAVIRGTQWEAWNGAIAVATVNGEHLKILRLDTRLKVTKEERVLLDHGRLRAVMMANDGSLYVGTSNGINDQIIRITAG